MNYKRLHFTPEQCDLITRGLLALEDSLDAKEQTQVSDIIHALASTLTLDEMERRTRAALAHYASLERNER